MISHCIPAAGVAGLIKTALALHHRVLPPTLCEAVNRARHRAHRLYVNREQGGRGLHRWASGAGRASIRSASAASTRTRSSSAGRGPPAALIGLALRAVRARCRFARRVADRAEALAAATGAQQRLEPSTPRLRRRFTPASQDGAAGLALVVRVARRSPRRCAAAAKLRGDDTPDWSTRGRRISRRAGCRASWRSSFLAGLAVQRHVRRPRAVLR